MKNPLVVAIRGYRYAIRPMLGANCRFFPSCSEYAQEAIERHGNLAGSWLAVKRLCKCHPYHPGGFDPEAIRKAALDVDIPAGGTIQGYGVKFFKPGTQLSGQNERSTPVVMQNAGQHISVVWPTNIRTQDPVFPLPKSSVYSG